MSRSSARGQVEPLVALAAIFAVVVGLSTYAGVLDGALADRTDDGHVAEQAADRLVGATSDAGAISPRRFAPVGAPDGYRLNATLWSRETRRAVGPPVPSGASVEKRRVSVRLGPGRIRPGRLTVRVWR